MAENDNVDEFTQRLLDRARQRRENLQKKLGETPVRKRSAPLNENQDDNIDIEQSNDESPKRPCMREVERNLKPDTPSIESVRSRRNALSSQYQDDEPDASSTKTSTPILQTVERTSRVPAAALEDSDRRKHISGDNSRRNRLAALAQDINSWEDDLKPTPTKFDHDEKPHSARDTSPMKSTSPYKRAGSPIKHTSPIKQTSPYRRTSPQKVTSPYKQTSDRQHTGMSLKSSIETHSTTCVIEPSKPQRTFDYNEEVAASTSQLRASQSSSQVSQITVNIRSDGGRGNLPTSRSATTISPADRAVPSKSGSTVTPMSSVQESGELDSTISQQPVAQRMAVWKNREQTTAQECDMDVTMLQQPVSVRMAAWKQKDSDTPIRSNTPARGKQRPVSTSIVGTPAAAKKWPPVAAEMERVRSQSQTSERRESNANEPTKLPVLSRMAAWQKQVDKVESEQNMRSVSPTRRSPVKSTSASQLTPASRSTSASHLTPAPAHRGRNPACSQSSSQLTPRRDTSPVKWQPTNASKSPEPKYSPVKAPVAGNSPVKSPAKQTPCDTPRSIHDRLKSLHQNMQHDEDNGHASELKQQRRQEIEQLQNRWKNGMPATEPITDPPANECTPAPPPPPPLMGRQANQKPVSNKRENARDKVRHDFESKLQSMGFDLHNTSKESGHIASIDLTPQRMRDKNKLATSNTEVGPPKPPRVEITEERVTTATFGPNKVISGKTIVNEEEIYRGSAASAVHSSSKTITLTPTTSKSITLTPSTPHTSSIYSLVKQQTGSTPVSTSAPTTATSKSSPNFPQLTAQLAARHRNTEQYGSQTSIDSQSSEYSEPQSEYTDTEYTEGEYTEAEYTEAECTETEYNEPQNKHTDKHVTEYTERQIDTVDEDEEEYSDEDEYTDEESDEEGGVDSLLDEAMDTTNMTEAESDIPPTYTKAISQQCTTSVSIGQSSSSQHARVTFTAPPAAHTPRVTEKRSNHPSTSTDEESDRNVYSIDLYRSTKKSAPPPPKMTIVRHSEHSPREEAPEEPLPYIPEKPVKQRLQELQELVNQEQNVIMQTSNALHQCCGTNSAFAGSPEAVECHRLLLIACKKREAMMLEMQRLRDQSGRPSGKPTTAGSLTISDIRIPLKSTFLDRLHTPADESVHYFILLLRHGEKLIQTQMMSTNDTMVRGALEFPNLIKLSEITQDFKLELEIYSMTIARENPTMTPSKKNRTLTPKSTKKKTLFGSKAHRLQSPGGPNAVASTNFAQIATLPISMRHLNKTHFSLDRIPFMSPLQGSIHMRFKCVLEASVEERGFLTMFEDVSGFGSWHRRWCTLKNGCLRFWKYPDDERNKEPIGCLDLKQCITGKVGLIPRDICARPNTFEICTVRRQTRGDADTLTTHCRDTMTTTRNQLSADTKEDRLAWCDKINEALQSLRTWHPDAMRPINQ